MASLSQAAWINSSSPCELNSPYPAVHILFVEQGCPPLWQLDSFLPPAAVSHLEELSLPRSCSGANKDTWNWKVQTGSGVLKHATELTFTTSQRFNPNPMTM